MTNEERDIIGQFIARVGGATPSGGFAGGSVHTQPALPPVDRDADAFIGQPSPSIPRRATASPSSPSCRSTRWSKRRTASSGWSGNCSRPSKPPSRRSSPPKAGRRRIFQWLVRWRQPAAAGSAAGRSAMGRPRRPGLPGRPAATAVLPAATAAAISAELPAGHVPAAWRLRLSSVGPDDRRRRGRRRGGRRSADEFVLPTSGLEGGGGFGGGVPGASPWATPAAPSQDYVDTGIGNRAAERLRPGQDYVDNGTWDQPAPAAIPRPPTTAAAGTAGEATARWRLGQRRQLGRYVLAVRSDADTGPGRTGIVYGVG